MNNKQTSKNIWTLASKKLKSKNSSESTKEQAWSSLAQRNKNKETSDKVAKNASKILKAKNESVNKKKLAWCNLSQARWKNIK